jgi:hypothetical protein
MAEGWLVHHSETNYSRLFLCTRTQLTHHILRDAYLLHVLQHYNSSIPIDKLAAMASSNLLDCIRILTLAEMIQQHISSYEKPALPPPHAKS